MLVHEPINNVHSTNQLLLYYSSPKTSENSHEFIMMLQQLLLDELEYSKDNSGLTLQGEKYDNDLYFSMKSFWDLFTGEITHEYTCTSCKNTIQNRELLNYLLLKFPDAHHECDEDCIVESLIEYHLQEEHFVDYQCSHCEKIFQQQESLPLLNFPPSCAFYSVTVEKAIIAPFLQQLSFLPLVLT